MDVPGLTLDLVEDDYKFGAGQLRLRIDAVLHVQSIGGQDWVLVRGTSIRWDGQDGRPRQVSIRAQRIQQALNRSAGRDQGPSAVTVDPEET